MIYLIKKKADHLFGTATENISAFFDFYLKSAVQTIPHILEDTRDFLSKSSYLQDTPENAIIVFFDMIVLYPKILYEEGIDIMRAFVNEISDKPISTENLYRLA